MPSQTTHIIGFQLGDTPPFGCADLSCSNKLIAQGAKYLEEDGAHPAGRCTIHGPLSVRSGRERERDRKVKDRSVEAGGGGTRASCDLLRPPHTCFVISWCRALPGIGPSGIRMRWSAAMPARLKMGVIARTGSQSCPTMTAMEIWCVYPVISTS